ncbi:MAG: DUF1573 domain-containing protein [Verrucomicrobiales bacterium]|jgi:hypothetical protein|nr:DUF1573 domain-containing protein [Verrucomicrobiales bacterium]
MAIREKNYGKYSIMKVSYIGIILIHFWLGCLVIPFNCIGEGLTWDQKNIKLEIDENVAKAEFIFSGKNLTKEPILISDIKTDCGCVNVVLSEKKIIPNGQVRITGVIQTEKIGETVQKRIILKTDGENEPKILSITIHKKQHISIKPRVVLWEQGEAAEAKQVTITLNGDLAPIALDAINSLNKIFTIKQKKQITPNIYEIWVIPQNTSSSCSAQFEISAKDDRGQYWVKNFYCLIQKGNQ